MPDKMEPCVELNTFVKLKNLATTGGQAKVLIRSGAVLVNGVAETRNKRKLFAGDKVSVDGQVFMVEKELLR